MFEQPIGPLAGKTAVVASVTNRFSLGWGIAQALHGAGARVLVTYQGERTERNVARLVADYPGMLSGALDVEHEAELDALLDRVRAELGGLDILVHAMAYAPEESLARPFIDTSRDAFATTLLISAYSLTSLARAVAPLMAERGGGSIVTLSYLGGERVVPHYNVMGVAKAALEASVRYLAYDLGPQNIRVNAISAGPVSTAAARGIAGFMSMMHHVAAASPLGRRTEPAEIGGTAAFLCSEAAKGITGEVIHVDSGYHAMGTMLQRERADGEA